MLPAPNAIPHRDVVLNGSSTPVSLSIVGYGLMSLTVFLGGINDPGHCSEEVAMEVIGAALAKGINLVNSASFYGSGANEVLLGKAIKKFGRDKFFITDKFGQIRETSGKPVRYDTTRAGVREQLFASLERLGTDYIDVYLPARITPETPIEETVAALKELVEEGKIRYVGLSEANAETIRRANKVYPIAFLETEYSLFSLHIQESILPTCRELGVKILAYSPLGRGMLTATVTPEKLAPNDMRRHMPRFTNENLSHNMQLVEKIKSLASQLGCSPGQLSIAWLMKPGNEDIFPIPGTKQVDRLEENMGAVSVKLDEKTIKEIDDALASFETKGMRYPDMAIIDWQDKEDREKIEKESQGKKDKL